MSWADKCTVAARRKLDVPDDWHVYLMESVDGGGLLVTGAIARRKARGPYKGDLTWRGKKVDQKRVFLTMEEVDAVDLTELNRSM